MSAKHSLDPRNCGGGASTRLPAARSTIREFASLTHSTEGRPADHSPAISLTHRLAGLVQTCRHQLRMTPPGRRTSQARTKVPPYGSEPMQRTRTPVRQYPSRAGEKGTPRSATVPSRRSTDDVASNILFTQISERSLPAAASAKSGLPRTPNRIARRTVAPDYDRLEEGTAND